MASKPDRPRHGGFSLVELMTIIAVISILGALAMTGIPKAQAMKNQTICSTQMRQIGAALLLYAGDHDGTLPGPSLGGQKPAYHEASQAATYKMLADYLVPYMNLRQATPGEVLIASPFVCPSWVAAMKRQPVASDITLGAAYNVRLPDGTVFVPFGYPLNGIKPAINPGRLQQYSKQASLAVLWDADAIVIPAYATSLPQQPAHSLKRNYLFLDGHVENLAQWP